jgi:hypothetical protein
MRLAGYWTSVLAASAVSVTGGLLPFILSLVVGVGAVVYGFMSAQHA